MRRKGKERLAIAEANVDAIIEAIVDAIADAIADAIVASLWRMRLDVPFVRRSRVLVNTRACLVITRTLSGR